MARTKHNRTGRGTHRQRIFQLKQANAQRRLALEAEATAAKAKAAEPTQFEVTEVGNE